MVLSPVATPTVMRRTVTSGYETDRSDRERTALPIATDLASVWAFDDIDDDDDDKTQGKQGKR